MRIVCHLREIRGDRSLSELQEETGIDKGELSRIERGLQLPRDIQLEALTLGYGCAAHLWYPAAVLLLIQHDDEEPA